MSKKGFEMQFNWLFVLIAGGIILSFFFLVIRNQINSSKIDESLGFQQDLDFILRASQGSRSTEKPIALGGKIIFECSDGISFYHFDGSNINSQYNYLSIFSPNLLDESHVLVKTETFKAPFSVMPFIYLSGKRVEYVFIGDSPEVKKLYNSFPENLTKKFFSPPDLFDISTFQDNNFNSVIFVTDSAYFNSDMRSKKADQFSDKRKAIISVVAIEPDSGVSNSYGKVYFYNQSASGFQQQGDVAFYSTFAHLLGAAFSGDRSLYACQFDKSIMRLGTVSELHWRRLSKINSEISGCGPYLSAMGTLSQLNESSRKKIDYGVIIEINDYVQQIKILNDRIVDDTICPPIY